MTVELLGGGRAVPRTPDALEDLLRILSEEGVEADVARIEVTDDEQARRERFPGSPTIRINGEDVVPPEDIEPYSLTCRVYRTRDGRVSPRPDPGGRARRGTESGVTAIGRSRARVRAPGHGWCRAIARDPGGRGVHVQPLPLCARLARPARGRPRATTRTSTSTRSTQRRGALPARLARRDARGWSARGAGRCRTCATSEDAGQAYRERRRRGRGRGSTPAACCATAGRPTPTTTTQPRRELAAGSARLRAGRRGRGAAGDGRIGCSVKWK